MSGRTTVADRDERGAGGGRAIVTAAPPSGVADRGVAERGVVLAWGARVWVGWTGFVVAVLCANVVLVPAPDGLRLAAVLAFVGLGPGAALVAHLDVGDAAVAWALVVVVSFATVAVTAAGMVWLGWWHPTGVAVVMCTGVAMSCLVGLASAARSHNSGARVRSPGLARWPWGRLLTLVAAVACWLVAVVLTDVSTVDEYGLLGTVHPAYFAALALCVAGFVASLRQRQSYRAIPLLYTVMLILVLHGTTPLLLSEPQYAWTYKHVGVVELLQRHGQLTDGRDIYQQWPAFFAAVADLADLSRSDPLRLAAGAPVLLNLAASVVLLAIARTLSSSWRVGYVTVFLFQCINWVEEDYLSPQGFAFVLGLGALLVALRWLCPGVPRRTQAAALAGLTAILAVLAASHQLTPYVIALGLGALAALRIVRPWWTLLVAIAVPVAYLVPRYDLVSGAFSLFDGFDLLANASGNAEGWGTTGQALSALTVRVLALGVWLLTAFAVARAWRRGRLDRVLAPAVLAGAPFLLLFAHSYGGEAIYRVFLFSAPWCAYLIADLVTRPPAAPTPRTARPRGWLLTAVLAGVGLTVPALATVQGRHGQLIVDRQTPATVAAAEYLYEHATPGATIMLATPSFPSRLAANYGEFNRSVAVGEPDLVEGARLRQVTLDAAYLPTVEEFARSFAGTTTYLVVSDGMQRQARYFGYLPDGSLDALVRAATNTPQWTVFYRNPEVVILQLNQ